MCFLNLDILKLQEFFSPIQNIFQAEYTAYCISASNSLLEFLIFENRIIRLPENFRFAGK